MKGDPTGPILCERCQHFAWEQNLLGMGSVATRALCTALTGADGLVSEKRILPIECHVMRFGGPCGRDAKLFKKRV